MISQEVVARGTILNTITLKLMSERMGVNISSDPKY